MFYVRSFTLQPQKVANVSISKSQRRSWWVPEFILFVCFPPWFLPFNPHRLRIFKQRSWPLKCWPAQQAREKRRHCYLCREFRLMRLVRRLNVSRILPFVIPELIEENFKNSNRAKWKTSGCVITEQLPRPSLKIQLWIYRCDFLAVSLSP